MKYVMKSSVLYRENTVSARIGRRFGTTERSIYLPDGTEVMKNRISADAEDSGDIRKRRYILEDAEGRP